MKNINYWEFIKRNVLTLSTALAGFIILILTAIGIIDIPLESKLILGLLIFLATSEIIEKSKRLDQIENTISDGMVEVIRSLDGVEVKKFTIISGGFDYLADRLKRTKTEIDHAAFAPPIPRWPKQAKKYTSSLDKVLKENKVRYRYIAALSPELGYHRLKQILRRMSDPTIRQYYAAYYEQSDYSIPHISYMVFDREEILMYYPPVIGEVETALAINHPDIVSVFSSYFIKLWSDSSTIREVYEVDELLKKYNPKAS